MTLFIQTLFSGLTNGAVFALIGVAIVFCYRSSGVVNLAQGETYMGSGMLMAKMAGWGLPIAVAAPAGFVLAVVFSLAFERFILRPRLQWRVSRLIVITVGVALVAEGLADRLVGADQYSFTPLLNGSPIRIAGAAIEPQAVLLIGVTVFLALTLGWFFRRTVIGYALTAVAERPATASLLGIRASTVRALAFGIAGFLGFVSALLLVPISPITYDVGLTLTLSGYVAAAIGNMRHVEVTCAAGLGIGMAEAIFGTYVNELLAEPLILGVLLIVGVAFLSRGVRFGGVARA